VSVCRHAHMSGNRSGTHYVLLLSEGALTYQRSLSPSLWLCHSFSPSRSFLALLSLSLSLAMCRCWEWVLTYQRASVPPRDQSGSFITELVLRFGLLK
jgi:hypothetical protein